MIEEATAVTTMDEAREYIAGVRWQFAKTMPQWPHEYTVRSWRPDLEAEFEAFAAMIHVRGETRPWGPYHHQYLDVDQWSYWTMGNPIAETTVINRALMEQPA